MGMGQMDRLWRLEFDLDPVEPRVVADADFGHAVGKIAALAEMGLDDGGEASSATSITLRVAMVRGAASVAMKTSSIGVSTLPVEPDAARRRSRRPRSSAAPARRASAVNSTAAVGALRMRRVISAVDDHHAGRGDAVEQRGAQQPLDVAPPPAATCWRGG